MNWVGHITATSMFSSVLLPNSLVCPSGKGSQQILIGLDDYFWLIEEGDNAIGRLMPSR